MAANKFKELPRAERVKCLVKCLTSAISENDKSKWRTDVYGIAKQYGKPYGINDKSDFDEIKDMTIDEIAKLT